MTHQGETHSGDWDRREREYQRRRGWYQDPDTPTDGSSSSGQQAPYGGPFGYDQAPTGYAQASGAANPGPLTDHYGNEYYSPQPRQNQPHSTAAQSLPSQHSTPDGGTHYPASHHQYATTSGGWTPAGTYPPSPGWTAQPTPADRDATTALILGLVGLFTLPLILGPLAIYFATRARRAGAQATPGLVLGWVCVGLSLLFVLPFLLIFLPLFFL